MININNEYLVAEKHIQTVRKGTSYKKTGTTFLGFDRYKDTSCLFIRTQSDLKLMFFTCAKCRDDEYKRLEKILNNLEEKKDEAINK